MRILVTGASGFVGAKLCQALAMTWEVTGTYLTNRKGVPPGVSARALDVRDPKAVAALFEQARPDAVVHAAAMTSLSACANRPADAESCNRDGTRHVARYTKLAGVPMVYLSTDLVFDGLRGWYHEEEIPKPSCIYGLTKRAGEVAAQEEAPHSCVLRVALTYGWSGNTRRCSLEALLAALRQGEEVRLFADEYRTPILLDDLCETVGLAVATGLRGVWHAAGPRRMSRYDLGMAAAGAFGLPTERIVPISRTAVDPTRPGDGSLVGSAKLEVLGCKHRDPTDGLAYMAANGPR